VQRSPVNRWSFEGFIIHNYANSKNMRKEDLIKKWKYANVSRAYRKPTAEWHYSSNGRNKK